VTFTSFSTSFNSRGGRLYAKLLLPENGNPLPLAILCHGAGSDHRAVESSAECIAKRGVATFLFDFRGHGLSSGIYDGNTADDVVAAFEHLANYPEIDLNHVALVGHSMGASAALLAAAKLDKLSALVLLSCPPDEFEAPPEEILNKNGNFVVEYPSQCSVPWTGSFLGFIYRPWMKLRGQRMRINWQRFFEVYKSGDLSTALAKVKSCPILFVHCRGDRYAPYQSAVQLYEQARQPKEIILEPGGFHSAPTRSGKLRGKWVNWLVSVLTGNTEVKGE
jgi:pimeloyl-ACP methyl ester carboxylesterase